LKVTNFFFGIAGLALLLMACGGGESEPTATSPPASGSAGSAAQLTGCVEPGSGADEIDAAKLYFEFNSTDDDTGVHGIFDSPGFTELCVYDPSGELIVAVNPQGTLKELGMGGIFFESREPEEGERSQADIIGSFDEGDYRVAAVTVDGEKLAGEAVFTHDIPLAPEIITPQEGDTVDPENFVVTWEPVSESINGDPIEIVGYEVIVTNDKVEDPNGLAQPILSAHVIPSVTSLTIPSEFLQPETEYELEIIAIEESGNQTISLIFFETP
jgi:hypothetical protein